MRLHIPMVILLTALSVSCFESESPTTPKSQLGPTDLAVLASVDTVRTAAEAFFAANSEYADWPCDGFIGLLPGGQRLVNPVSGERTEPVSYEPSGVGSVSYRLLADANQDGTRRVVGYYIVGRGEAQDFVATNVSNPAVHIQNEQLVYQNCQQLRLACDAFAADNSGEYAMFEGSTNAVGKTVTDYLPGGERMLNPYTGERTEPSVWWHGEYPVEQPTGMGQLSYVPWDHEGDGWLDGFMIGAIAEYAPTHLYHYEKWAVAGEGGEAELFGADYFYPSRPCVWP